nr:glycosyltransferase family 2 protein [Halomarina rubra]
MFFSIVVGVSASVFITTGASAVGHRLEPVSLTLWIVTLIAGALAGSTLAGLWTGEAGSPLFLAAFVVFFVYVWFVVPLAVYQRYTTTDDAYSETSLPTVSVIVPAYNEEGYVGRCIDHILASEYPSEKLDVLVVDDGSTDGTLTEAREHAGTAARVHTRPNSGKHAALNYGLEATTGEIVIIIDADSFVEPSALARIVTSFGTDSRVGGIASDVRVVNRQNSVSRLQTLEYVLGINTYRRAFDYFSAIPVVPGCLGAFRREALLEVGGYDNDTLTEDFDVTIKLLKAGWTIRHSSARVWTEAPYSWRDLYRQRVRWNRGNLEVLQKHADVFASDASRYLHRLVFPFRLGTMLLAPVVAVGVTIAVGLSVLTGNLETVAGMVTYFALVGTFLATLAIRLEGESLRLVPYAIPLVVAYPLFQAVVIAVSIAYTLSSHDRKWANVKRLAQDPVAERV